MARRASTIPALLRLAFRANPRTRATVLGIAFAILLLVTGFSLLGGLRAGVDEVANRVESPPVLFLAGDDLATSRIGASLLATVPGDYLTLRALPVALVLGNASANATAALVERRDGSALWPVAPGGVLLGEFLRYRLSGPTPIAQGVPARLVASAGTASLAYAGTYPSIRPFPGDWAVLSRADLVNLQPSLGTTANAIIVDPDNPDGIRTLRVAGLHEVPTVAAADFLRTGTDEVLASLSPLVAAVGGIVALLVYNGMGVEVAQRAREVRLLRQIGAAPRRIRGLYLAQALYLAFLGGLLGLAGGIVAAHGIVSFAPLLGLANVVTVSVPLDLAALALGTSLVAGSLGGLVPATRAGRLPAPRREVVLSS